MDADEFFSQVDECPDDQLTFEFGICDNCEVLLNSDSATLRDVLEKSGKFKFRERHKKSQSKRVATYMDYIPGTIIVQFYEGIHPTQLSDVDGTYPDLKDDAERQARDYNMVLLFHTYNENKIPNTHPNRAIAISLKDVKDLAEQNGIAMCINNLSTKYILNPKTREKIVYIDAK